ADLDFDVVVNAGPPTTVTFASIPDLAPFASQSLVVCASGFLAPGDNQSGPALDLIAFAPEGGAGISLSD
ncbi:MAG: hypothetical protein AAF658_11645, partial [Myxococcota bacterium]